MSGNPQPQRVRQAHAEWVLERLSPRDRAIIADVGRVRLLTSSQLERLHFSELSGRSRSVVRAQVLKRLSDWRVLTSLPRRIGGMSGGSAELAYALDSAGQRLHAILSRSTSDAGRIRRPGLPSERFVRHTLAISELYVRATEVSHTGSLQLMDFKAEPDAWLPDGLGGLLKPDAFLIVAAGSVEDSWAVEVDKATEHIPALKRKLSMYLDFVRRGQLGPGGVVPRVLITVPDTDRYAAVAKLIEALPEPANALFHLCLEVRAIETVAEVLLE